MCDYEEKRDVTETVRITFYSGVLGNKIIFDLCCKDTANSKQVSEKLFLHLKQSNLSELNKSK